MKLCELRKKYPESFLLEYIEKCSAGEIVVGHEMKQEFDILLENFCDDEIKIDFKDAHKRIKFIETKCKHFEAPFAGKPFILELWQKAFIESIYIFKIYDDEVKRYVRLIQDILLIVGKKNGKTPLIAAICLAEYFCGQMGTKILCSSNDYEQADLMYQAIDAMREESPALEKTTRSNIKGIFFGNPKSKKTKGKFSYQNKGNIKKISANKGSKEGRNIAVGAVDEIHELKSDIPIMPIRQGLSTQDEPLYIELTTEGFVNDGYLDTRAKEARQVLKRELERPRWSIWLYTQDSEKEVWANEKAWYKSNPNLGVSKKWSYLRQIVDEARTNKKTRVSVLAKDFNVKQNNAEAWLMVDDIKNPATFNIEEFRNGFAIGAADLSKTGDLTNARAMLMKPGSDMKYMITQYFIPESKIEKIPKDDQPRYHEWIKQGLITVSPGNENDFSKVTEWFWSLYKDYGIRFYLIGYDKWSAIYWVNEMKDDYGFDCLRVSQDYGTMSDPMTLLETDLKSKLVNYNNNPIDEYCLQNTAMKMNNKLDIMPCKIEGQAEKKIDGGVTMIICYRVYIDNRTEFLELSRRGLG